MSLGRNTHVATLGTIWVLLFGATAARCEDDTKQLLERIAYACRVAYLNGYFVHIRRWELTSNRMNAGGSTADRQGTPVPVIPFGNDGFRGDITLARLKTSFRYEIRNSLGQTWQWITDGKLVWSYRPDRNVYTQAKAQPGPERLGPEPGLPGIEWKYVTRFLAIGDMSQRATVVRDDIGPDNNCSGPSVLIKLSLSDDLTAPSSESLRVLTRSYLPCYSVITRRERGWRLTMTDTVESMTWRFRDEPPDANEVAFHPKSSARLVKRLPRD